MQGNIVKIILIVIVLLLILKGEAGENMFPDRTHEVLLTSEAGDRIAQKDNIAFMAGYAQKNVITIYPKQKKQTMTGVGSSITESSAFVLAHLEPDERRALMENLFSEKGANFPLIRTHIGACDFCVEGRYSYAREADKELKGFSIAEDKKGFSRSEYSGIKDESYDLLPMLKEALAIKQNQKDKELMIVSSAWTAPYWMKDINDWYIPGAPENNWQGSGGSLKKGYELVYADYLVKYLQAYQLEGVKIWGITPVNEPHGNNGQWESMNFSPASQNDFIKKYLGPKLRASGFQDVKLLIYDQNRDGIEAWTDEILADKESRKYVYGTAVHWYESTYKVYEDVFERVHNKFPDKAIMHTEGCIDDLGKQAPGGVTDPEGFQEKNWFKNDSFWWNKTATDWAYSVTWQGVKVEDHPMYTPVHRYARNIIVSIDHWLEGWIDWNVVLDSKGGPNHVGNYCGAPVMIDTHNSEIYYTPVYYVLSQFSQTIRPGDKAVQTSKNLPELGEDEVHTCATINKEGLLSVQLLNTTGHVIELNLQIEDRFLKLSLPANSVETLRIQL